MIPLVATRPSGYFTGPSHRTRIRGLQYVVGRSPLDARIDDPARPAEWLGHPESGWFAVAPAGYGPAASDRCVGPGRTLERRQRPDWHLSSGRYGSRPASRDVPCDAGCEGRVFGGRSRLRAGRDDRALREFDPLTTGDAAATVSATSGSASSPAPVAAESTGHVAPPSSPSNAPAPHESLPALLRDRLRWLNEYDAAALALQKATHPEPSPEQQASDAKD